MALVGLGVLGVIVLDIAERGEGAGRGGRVEGGRQASGCAC